MIVACHKLLNIYVIETTVVIKAIETISRIQSGSSHCWNKNTEKLGKVSRNSYTTSTAKNANIWNSPGCIMVIAKSYPYAFFFLEKLENGC